MQGTLKDAYTWRVVYEDGKTYICENEKNGFADVDKARVTTILLISRLDDSSYRVDVPKGATPVFFRRRIVEINPISGEENNRLAVHCIGWKRGNEAVYLFVLGEGNALLTSDLQAV